jgi:hypothetical protein
MKLKHCPKCQQDKPVGKGGAFARNPTKKDGWCIYCRDCQNESNRGHYARNKSYYVEKAQRRKDEIRKIINAAKNKPCADCKKEYPPWVMDFDHLPGVEKCFNVAQWAQHTGIKKLLVEIEKCEVVCANCHRQRTHDRHDAPIT